MKTKKLSPILALIIAFELIVAPTAAYAQNVGTTIMGALGSAVQSYTATMNAGQQNLTFEDALLKQQTQNQPDEYFNAQKMSQIPGLQAWLATQNKDLSFVSCATLRTSLNEVKFDGCSDKPSIIGINPNIAKQMAEQYKIKYEEIAKIYRNYGEDSLAANQGFGVGCMKNAMLTLQSFFNARLSLLEGLTADLETATSKFQEDSRADLNAIEEDTALLEGGDNELTDNVKTRRPDLFDFSKRFDSAECKAMFPLKNYDDFGKKKGLNEISNQLKERLNAKDKDSKYSGDSYSSGHANVLKDINDLATKVKNQVNLDFREIAGQSGYSGFVGGLKDKVSSNEGLNEILKPGFFSEIQNSYQTSNKKLQDETRLLASELRSVNGGSEVFNLLADVDAGGFEEELSSMRNGIENKCLAGTFAGTNSVSNVLKRIDSNESSKFALKNASNIKPRLQQIMSDTNTSMDRKMQLLAELEKQTGDRYFLTMDNSYDYSEVDKNNNVKKTTVIASESQTPSKYFTNMIKNCQAQFSSNFVTNKITGAKALERLRALRNNYKDLRQNLQTNMSNEVKRKLINCSTPAQASNSVAGSCTPESFNPSSQNFCANGAIDCANKMKQCNARAEKFVTDIKSDRTTRVNQYKNEVEQYRNTLNNRFNAILNKFRTEGGTLSSLFGAAYAVPNGIKTQLSEKERYLESFQAATSDSKDGRLLLEDPAKYAEMMKKNIDALKASVVAQQQALMGPSSILNTHITANTIPTYKKVADQAQDLANKCNSGRAFYENVIQEQMNQQKQFGEKKNQLCARFNVGSSDNPAGYCSGNIEDMMATFPNEVATLQSYCKQSNNHDESNSETNRNAADICAEYPSFATVPDIKSTALYTACYHYYEASNCDPNEEITNANGIKEKKKCKGVQQLQARVIAIDKKEKFESEEGPQVPSTPIMCRSIENTLTPMMPDFTGGMGGSNIGSSQGIIR